MADIYVDSNATGGSQTGASWANAYLTLAAAAAVDGTGDTIWVAHNHAESTAASVSLAWAGSAASPNRVICANSGSGEPPATLATTATVTVTGTGNDLTLQSASSTWLYFYGISFIADDQLTVTNTFSRVDLESCSLQITGGSSGRITLGGHTSATVKVVNTDFKFSHASQGIQGSNQVIEIQGGSVLSGGTSPTNLFGSVTAIGLILIDGFDFSNLSATANLDPTTHSRGLQVIVRNCKLPSSFSGALAGILGSVSDGSRFEYHNVSDGDVNYALYAETILGTIAHETTLVKSGGASDGTTPISWEMTTTADAEWSHVVLDSPEIVRWVPDTAIGETLDTSTTIEIDILHDSLTALTDQEIWLEVQYLGTSGFPLSLFADDAATSYTSNSTSQSTSTASWTTTGMTNPNKQKLSVVITPREAGYLIVTVKLAKASYIVYVDPLITVTQ